MLLPVVGYHGGKRRLLPLIRALLPVQRIERYVEPFVGMGAVYLDLRSRGYGGPAVLADSNRCVADFWRFVHGVEGAALVESASRISATSDPEAYYAAMRQDEDDPVRRVARFLWLTNYAYANVAPTYRGGGMGWVGSGCKLTSAAKWNKTFPWLKCVERLRFAVHALQGCPCKVHDDVSEVVLGEADSVYADPPYLGRRGYRSNGDANREHVDHADAIFGWPSQHIIYSETRLLSLPAGWQEASMVVTARASRNRDPGAVGRRQERVYYRW